MNYVQPVMNPINNHEIISWENKFYEYRNKYEKFFTDMKMLNFTEEEINKKWINNFGDIPPNKPNEIYLCNVINSDIKLSVTVLRNRDFKDNEREFQVIKLNKLYLDNYDYQRVMKTEMKLAFKTVYKDVTVIDKVTESNILYIERKNQNLKTTLNIYRNNNALEFLKNKTEYMDVDNNLLINLSVDNEGILSKSNLSLEVDENNGLTTSEITIENNNDTNIDNERIDYLFQEEGSMSLEYLYLYENTNINELFKFNYEDSGWFSLIHIKDMLDKLSIKVEPYNHQVDAPHYIPKVFFFNMNHMEIVNFDFNDIEFKENLYDLIDKRFRELIIN